MSHFVEIEGRVLGYLGDQYTRGIQAMVVLSIYAPDRDGFPEAFEVAVAFLGKLKRHRPDIHAAVAHLSNVLGPRLSDKRGEFRFERVPVGDWSYAIDAYDREVHVSQDELLETPFGTTELDGRRWLGHHTEPMGQDGRGARAPLHGRDLLLEEKRTGVIVPVFEEWYQHSTGPFPGTHPLTHDFGCQKLPLRRRRQRSGHS